MIFIVSALAASACGLYGIFLLIYKPNLLKLFNVMAVSILLGYTLGTVVFLGGTYFSTGSTDPSQNVFNFSFGKDDISLALLIVIMTSVLLFELARFEAPLVRTFKARLKRDTNAPEKYVVISAVVIISAYFTGQIGYMGIQLGEFGEVGILGAIAFLLVPPLLPITACEIMSARSLRYRVFLMVIFSLLLLSSILFGRRVFVYSLVTTLIGLSIAGFRLPKISYKRWLTIAVGVPVLFLVVFSGFVFFFSLRLTIDSVRHQVPMFELLHNTKDFMQWNSPELYSQLSGNLTERPYILSYLAGFVAAQRTYSPLWGQEIGYALQTAIPSVLFPNKLLTLPKMQEEFVHPAFGISIFDGPSTIMTAGLNDFGIAGAIIYPVVLVLTYGLFLRIVFQHIPPFLFQMVLFRFIFQLLYLEQSLSGMLTSSLRDIAFITVLFLLISKLPNITLGSRGMEQEIQS
jgi:hypothetical protein